MNLTPQQQKDLRSKLLGSIDLDGAAEFDSRFLNPLFSSVDEFISWCTKWNLHYEFISYAGINRSTTPKEPIRWVQLTHHQTPMEFRLLEENRITERNLILIDGKDEEL